MRSSSPAKGGLAVPARKIACDKCRERKVRCNASKPRCDCCEKLGLTCVYTLDSSARKVGKSIRPDARKDISDRLSRIENFLSKHVQNQSEASEEPVKSSHAAPPRATSKASTSSSETTPDSTPVPPQDLSVRSLIYSSEKLLFEGHHIGQLSLQHSLPTFSTSGQTWIKTRTGENTSLRNLVMLTKPWENGNCPRPTSTIVLSMAMNIPERQVVEKYIDAYCSLGLKQVFPIIDPVRFARTVDLAYNSGLSPSDSRAVNAKASIMSFLSFVSLVQGDSDTAPPVEGDKCAAEVQRLIGQIFLDPKVESLEICLMQSMYYIFRGNPQTASIMLSAACRIMFVLRAHLHLPDDDSADQTSRESRHLRNLFWLCYVCDKEITLRTGLPPVIDDDDCDMSLPDGYAERLYAIGGGCELWDEKSPVFLPGDLRLCILKAKIFKLLYSKEALGTTDAELLKRIRELDHELESWRMSVPAQFRPAISFSRNIRVNSEMAVPHRMGILITHFDYHYLVTNIHRASGRCRAWIDGKSAELEGVISSLSLSVEASRSTLRYMSAASYLLEGGAFWVLIFYPLSAALTLFSSILANPLHQSAVDDMELLKSTAELVRHIPIRTITASEASHMNMIEVFIKSLLQFINNAVQKGHQTRLLLSG